MGTVATLSVRITASLADFTKQIAGMEGQMSKTGARLQSIGGDLTKSITLPIVAIGGAAIKMSMDFNTAMTKVQTLASESAENIDFLKKKVLALAPTVGIGPTALADALLVIESTGFRGAEAMGILEMSAKASAVGMGDTKDVARALTAAINAYGIENLTAAQAADVLFATVDAGGAEADQLAGELGRIVGVASQLGVSFQEVGAFIATYTRLGLSAAEATTGLSGVLNTILSPSAEARDALAGMGMSAKTLRDNVAEHGLSAALIDLQAKLGGNADATGALFGNVRALAGVMGTAGTQANTYKETLAKIGDSTGILNERFAIWKTTMGATWKELIATALVAAVQLGDALSKPLAEILKNTKPLQEALVGLVKWFSELPSGVQNTTIGLLAAGAALGPFVYAIGTILKTGSGFIGLLRMVGVTGTLAGAGTTAAAGGATAMWAALAVPAGVIAGLLAAAAAVYKVRQAATDDEGWFGELVRKSVGASYEGLPSRKGMKGDIELAPDAGKGGFEETVKRLQAEATAVGAMGGHAYEATGKISAFEQSIRSLVERIGGSDLVNTANQWVMAIGRIGGIGKLTHDELTQFTSDIAAAVEKMRLLGQEVPRTWAIIADTVKQDAALQKTRDFIGQSMQGFEMNRQQVYAPGGQMDSHMIGGLMQAVPQAISSQNASANVAIAGDTLARAFKGGWNESIASLPLTIMSALTGGGDVGKSIGGLFGGEILGGLTGKLTQSLSGMFGKTIGGALGSVIPGLGTLLGSMIGPLIGKVAGKIWSGIQGAFGTDEEARDVNPARDAFLAGFGGAGTGAGSGFQALAAKLTELTGEGGGGALFQALTQADTMAEFQAAVSAIEEKLASVTTTATEGFTSTTLATDGMNLSLQGSDEAIKALGETQLSVVNVMLAGFDALMAKLSEFINALTTARSIAESMPVPAAPMSDAGVWNPGANVGYEEIPSFANEGMVRRPTFAMIGDAPEPEYVLRQSTVEGLARAGSSSDSPMINVSINGGTIIGSSEEFRQAVAEAYHQAVEKGGSSFQKFRKLSAQALQAT